MKLVEFVYRIFIRFINNYWDEPATLILQPLFLAAMRFHVGKCNIKERGLYWSLLVLLDCFFRNIKKLLFLPCAKFVSQTNSFGIYWVKLFIDLLTCLLLDLAYLPNFCKTKSTSATFLWRKVTNGRNGSSSALTEAKLIICQKRSIMVKGLFYMIPVFLSQPFSMLVKPLI